MTRQYPTPSRLRELLDYDPGTGLVVSRKTGRTIGAPAGIGGRLQVQVDGINVYVHRMAWAYVHDQWPEQQIDHINGDPVDNRIANLRLATNAENTQNKSRPRRDNVSGLLGVGFDKRTNRWRARIMCAGKSHHLGFYGTAEEAHAAYLRAKRELHPFWAAVA